MINGLDQFLTTINKHTDLFVGALVFVLFAIYMWRQIKG